MSNLATKYRPNTLDKVIGQPVAVKLFQNAIASKKLSNCYLLTGGSGTGKTTLARCVANELGCKPVDVIEIDMASNNGIDTARDLIQQVSYATMGGSHRVIILDECHMASNACFNALLKTLEDAPKNTTFFLCTTEPQKVITTIQSRSVRLDLKKVGVDTLVEHLATIADAEKIEIDFESLFLIARAARGGVRKAITLLEGLIVSQGSNVSLDATKEALGATDEVNYLELVKAIRTSPLVVKTKVDELESQVNDPLMVAESLHRFLVGMTIARLSYQASELIVDQKLIESELEFWSDKKLYSLVECLRRCIVEMKYSRYGVIWLVSALNTFGRRFNKETEKKAVEVKKTTVERMDEPLYNDKVINLRVLEEKVTPVTKRLLSTIVRGDYDEVESKVTLVFDKKEDLELLKAKRGELLPLIQEVYKVSQVTAKVV